MKATVAVLLLMFTAHGLWGQSSKRTSAYNYMNDGVLDKAKEAIDEAAKHRKTEDDAKTWLYRGQIYAMIASSEKPEYQKLSDQPMLEAYQSYKKVLKYDDRDRYSRDASNQILNLSLQFFNQAVQQYNQAVQASTEEAFAESLTYYERFFEARNFLNEDNVERLDNTLEENDISLNSIKLQMAESALQAGDLKKAKSYFSQLVNNQVEQDYPYRRLMNVYLQEGDTTKALDIIDKGRKVMPRSKQLALDEADLYLKMGRSEELIMKLKDALELSPENNTIKLALGDAYKNLDSTQKAMKMYQQVYEDQPDNFFANYNIGVIQYNQGADYINESLEKSGSAASKLQNKAKEKFKEAISYLEKAHEVKPEDPGPISPLREIYVRLGMDEKADELTN